MSYTARQADLGALPQHVFARHMTLVLTSAPHHTAPCLHALQRASCIDVHCYSAIITAHTVTTLDVEMCLKDGQLLPSCSTAVQQLLCCCAQRSVATVHSNGVAAVTWNPAFRTLQQHHDISNAAGLCLLQALL
jgi:hypothetical protein